MKIFLDSDDRQMPSGWIHLRWPDEVIRILKKQSVDIISLTESLGDDQRAGGMDLLVWIEVRWRTYGHLPPVCVVHDQDPISRVRLQQQIDKLKALIHDA
jgi:hypothetical protein